MGKKVILIPAQKEMFAKFLGVGYEEVAHILDPIFEQGVSASELKDLSDLLWSLKAKSEGPKDLEAYYMKKLQEDPDGFFDELNFETALWEFIPQTEKEDQLIIGRLSLTFTGYNDIRHHQAEKIRIMHEILKNGFISILNKGEYQKPENMANAG
jgi:hypothetical protein